MTGRRITTCLGALLVMLPPHGAAAEEGLLAPLNDSVDHAALEVAGEPERAQPLDGEGDLQDLIDEFDSKLALFYAAYESAKDDADREAIIRSSYPKPAAFKPRFLALAEAHKGTDTGARALAWVVSHLYGDSRDAAIERLLNEYSKSKVLAEVLVLVDSNEASILAQLQAIIEATPHADVRGHACFTLGRNLINGAQALPAAEAEPQISRARALLERVQSQFADLQFNGSLLSEWAAGILFEHDRLQIGMLAPDIEGGDLDGVSFKLSDYRGKVVVLDFWGDW